MATTSPATPAEFPTVRVDDAANAESGRIPVTRNLVMDAVEQVMLTEDRPAFRPGGALEEAGDVTGPAPEASAGASTAGTSAGASTAGAS